MMNPKNPPEIRLEMMRQSLYSAVISDALDLAGFKRQSPNVHLAPLVGNCVLIGRCKTTLWADMAHDDPRPYELELAAVDSCQKDDVFVAAANGSMRSGIWGELLSLAARNQGCVGAIVDGAVRDVSKMRHMNFPCFARGTSPYDSRNRQRVVDMDVPVEIGGVAICPGDLVVADEDGMVVVPRHAERQIVAEAWCKVQSENEVRKSIREGCSATEVFSRYGVL